MIDLHIHILPGVDDGPADLASSLAMAKACLGAGIHRVTATPHVNERWGSDVEIRRKAHRELTSRLAEESIPLEVAFGAEIALSTAIEMSPSELSEFRLGGADWLLIEPPPVGPPAAIHSMVFGVQAAGHRVLIAHPERSRPLREHLDLLGSLVDGGVRTQVTASALTGRFGSTAERAARLMFDRGLVHTIASDAHDATNRPPELADALTGSNLSELAGWLCDEMPAWILEGGDEPIRPAFAPPKVRRGLLGRLGRKR